MKRKDMDPKYQWDFTHIYPDKAAWENAMAEAEAAVAGLAALPGTLKKSLPITPGVESICFQLPSLSLLCNDT